MNKYTISEMQHYIEAKSRYAQLLRDRFSNPEMYAHTLHAIKKGFDVLGIPLTHLRSIENRKHLIVWLGRRLTEYTGHELAVYLGHKKVGLPVSEALVKKCPPELVAIVENKGDHSYIHDYRKELKERSFTPEMLLVLHRSMMHARTEHLLSDQLNNIDQLSFITIEDAVKQIPAVFTEYLSDGSLVRLIKKIAFRLREVTQKYEEELKNIDLYSLRLKEQLQELYLDADKGLKEIIENDVAGGSDISTITQKTSNLFSRLDRLFLGNIYHLKEYENRWSEIHQQLQRSEDYRHSVEKRVYNKRKSISELYEEYLFFHNFGPLNKDEERLFVKSATQEFEALHRRKDRSVSLLKSYEKKGLLSIELDFGGLMNVYHAFMKEIIIRHTLKHLLLEIVTCLPPAPKSPQKVVHDAAHLMILSLKGKNILDLEERERGYDKVIAEAVEQFRTCVTILVYDIRGSSYMGTKLHNAVKEQRIKYKFAKEMAEIAKRYGGFLLKDTGDGGLVWFAENSETLYNHLYTESVTGRGIKLRYSIFSGAEFDLIPSGDAAKRAMLCARDMVGRAEEFIRANFLHYREWFAEVAERTLELDGITYALLPPEFKSLFRIGVGIASGRPDKDVVFSANSYGDPDLVGPIISDAALYSMERQPGRSVVICDSASMINLILNIENFKYPCDEADFEKYINTVGELRRTQHGYVLPDHKIAVSPKGYHDLEELNKAKALKSDEIPFVYLDAPYLYNDHKHKIKPIYEVINL